MPLAGTATDAEPIVPDDRKWGASELALIHAAERLFAEHGIKGVSLRQINQAANHKNISAAHYHFGSRDGLILAVLQYRVKDLDERRRRFLDRSDRVRDLKFYVEALVVTLADELEPRAEGNHYLQFIHQFERYKGAQDLARAISPVGVDIYAHIEEIIFYLPEPVRRTRIEYLVGIVHGVLAAVETRLGLGEVTRTEIPLIAANLVDMVSAALSAPISVDTLSVLDKGLA